MPRTVLWSATAGDIPANLAFTNNYNATTDPAVTDDATKKYSPGSVWINKATGRTFVMSDSTAGAAVWAQSSSVGGVGTQAAPASQDTAGTLTPAQIRNGIVTTNPAGAINLQLPLATDLDAAAPTAAVGAAFDFSIIDLSGANAATLTTNTGWTLVGSMLIAAGSSGRFRTRKTGAGAWTLYRIS